jgi:hypothetical protein
MPPIPDAPTDVTVMVLADASAPEKESNGRFEFSHLAITPIKRSIVTIRVAIAAIRIIASSKSGIKILSFHLVDVVGTLVHNVANAFVFGGFFVAAGKDLDHRVAVLAIETRVDVAVHPVGYIIHRNHV